MSDLGGCIDCERARAGRGLPSALLVGFAALALFTGCGSAGGSAPAPQTPALPYVAIRPEDVRLAAAASDLTARFGHDLMYDVDADVLKDHAPNLQEELADAFETISRALERARAERPEAVARACAVVKKIRVELDEKTREHRAWLAGDALVLRVPTHTRGFATDEAVLSALLAHEGGAGRSHGAPATPR